MPIPTDPTQQLLNSAVFDLVYVEIALFMLAAPIIVVLLIRFLWYRHVYVGRSQELDKLVWQLHRIASALEARQVAAPQDAAPAAAPPQRPMPMSMFGR